MTVGLQVEIVTVERSGAFGGLDGAVGEEGAAGPLGLPEGVDGGALGALDGPLAGLDEPDTGQEVV
jgi:hypothetical protein